MFSGFSFGGAATPASAAAAGAASFGGGADVLPAFGAAAGGLFGAPKPACSVCGDRAAPCLCGAVPVKAAKQTPKKGGRKGGGGGRSRRAAPQPTVPREINAPATAAELALPLSSVILTVNDQRQSYDQLFTAVPQKGDTDADGGATRVAVYEASYSQLRLLVCALNNPGSVAVTAEALAADRRLIYYKIAQEVLSVDGDCFLLNLECCGCCSESGFRVQAADDKAALWELLEFAIQRGSMAMASDFSLKAMIADWNENVLGPNPFVRKERECGQSFELSFDPEVLKACPSAQLAAVGELCEKDAKAVSHAMSGTVVFGLAEPAPATTAFQLQTLSKVSSIDGARNTDASVVGHAILEYPSGGLFLASMGHWIELARLDVSQESVLRAADGVSAEYGAQVRTQMVSAGDRNAGEGRDDAEVLARDRAEQDADEKQEGKEVLKLRRTRHGTAYE